jgi:putative intracellular protease/amidase
MHDLSRRAAGRLASMAALFAAGGTPPAVGQVAATPATPRPPEPAHDMAGVPDHWVGKERIAFLIYPGFTALDMVGPHYMLTNLMGATVHVVAATTAPVASDTGLVFTPDADFSTSWEDPDIICLPGGTTGTLAAMQDRATLNWVASRGARAGIVASVCTGSLILGAAGLLRGKRATSHWLTVPQLALFGAEPVAARVVQDGKVITGAGVTAGLDFGLSLVARLRDRPYAEVVQLLAEYAPDPPFQAGTPATAPAEAVAMLEAMLGGFRQRVEEVARASPAR